MNRYLKLLSMIAFVAGLIFDNAVAANSVARATFVNGDVQVRNAAGAMRPLARGGELASGDSVVTGDNGSAQLTFADNSRVAVRASSEITIDEFKMSGGGSDEGFVLSLARGALRSITGLIGQRNKKNFSLHTPVATIGIRGTDFEAVHVPPGGGKAFGGNVDPGTYNKVYAGGTHLMSNAGAIDLNINETGFIGIGGKNAQTGPVKIDQLPPGILKVINAAPIIGKAEPVKPDGAASPADGNSSSQGATGNTSASTTELKLDTTTLKATTLPTTTEITTLPTTTINTSTLSTVNSSTLKTIDTSTLSTTPVTTSTTAVQTINTSTLNNATLTTLPTTTTTTTTTTLPATTTITTLPTTTNLKLNTTVITK